jgi:hypothetical protein
MRNPVPEVIPGAPVTAGIHMGICCCRFSLDTRLNALFCYKFIVLKPKEVTTGWNLAIPCKEGWSS